MRKIFKLITTMLVVSAALITTGCSDSNETKKVEKVRVIVLQPKVVQGCKADTNKKDQK